MLYKKESPAELDHEILQAVSEIISLLYKIQLNKERILAAQSTLGMVTLSSAAINIKTQKQKDDLKKEFLSYSMGIGYKLPDYARSLPAETILS